MAYFPWCSIVQCELGGGRDAAPVSLPGLASSSCSLHDALTACSSAYEAAGDWLHAVMPSVSRELNLLSISGGQVDVVIPSHQDPRDMDECLRDLGRALLGTSVYVLSRGSFKACSLEAACPDRLQDLGAKARECLKAHMEDEMGEPCAANLLMSVAASIRVSPAMDAARSALDEAGHQNVVEAVYQNIHVLCFGAGQLRVLTWAFIGSTPSGLRPDQKYTPYVLRLRTCDLIAAASLDLPSIPADYTVTDAQGALSTKAFVEDRLSIIVTCADAGIWDPFHSEMETVPKPSGVLGLVAACIFENKSNSFEDYSRLLPDWSSKSTNSGAMGELVQQTTELVAESLQELASRQEVHLPWFDSKRCWLCSTGHYQGSVQWAMGIMVPIQELSMLDVDFKAMVASSEALLQQAVVLAGQEGKLRQSHSSRAQLLLQLAHVVCGNASENPSPARQEHLAAASPEALRSVPSSAKRGSPSTASFTSPEAVGQHVDIGTISKLARQVLQAKPNVEKALAKASIDGVVNVQVGMGRFTVHSASGNRFVLVRDAVAPETACFELVATRGRQVAEQELRTWPLAVEPRAPKICELCGPAAGMPRMSVFVDAEKSMMRYVCLRNRRHVFELQPNGSFARAERVGHKAARTERTLKFATP